MKYLLSTIDPNAHITAQKHGLELEIAEYCTAWNLDDKLAETDPVVREKLTHAGAAVLHGPFNELFPCAIDPMVRNVAKIRYRQALDMARSCGITRVVIHGGYNPRLYYPIWYTEQSVVFWKEFIREVPEDMTILLENVMEEEIPMFLTILEQVADKRLRMCLDVGHVNAYSTSTPMEWLEACAPYIQHFHIHNNHGDWDTHNPLGDGTIPMKQLLCRAEELCPEATATLELMEAESGVLWLKAQGLL